VIEDKHSWWTELRHGGMLISPAVLREIFPVGYEQPNTWKYRVLRDKYLKFEKWWNDENRSQTQLAPLHSWLNSVFEDFLELNENQWIKENKISPEQSITTLLGERIKPNRIYYRNAGDDTPSLVMFIDSNQKLGFGKSRKQYGKVLEYLRTRKIKLAIFTNGYTIRLCYAGLDNDSFVEWDTSNWFSEGELATQLFGFYTLLGKYGFDKRDDIDFPLIKAIEDSRTRQGELSSVLGEQVRQSIEILLNQFGQTRLSNPSFTDPVKNIYGEEDLPAIFQAAVRIVMRLVVLLFAEARDLLPKSNELYHNHYGIEGLFEQLRKAKVSESSDFLEDSDSSWIRFQSLCKIVYQGSHYPDLQIPAYGGELFAPGDINSTDNIKRAIALFEDPQLHINNDSFLKILERLKYGKLKIKQGRSSTFIKGPVDFRELRTEFIGMIYEGILDYELKCAQEPMLLLNAGPQPILPLSVLEGLSDRQIKDLFEKIKQKDKTDDEGEDEADVEAEAVEDEVIVEEEEVEEETTEEADEEETIDEINETEKRAQLWAEKAVEVLGWVRKPRRTQDEYTYELEKRKRAKSLIKETYNEKDFYITRWGGTRKGTGTFYTKPQLAVPTVRRTLEPLCYTDSVEQEYIVKQVADTQQISEPSVAYQSKVLIPKTPEEILSLKVCDPACGSGSFDVAALNYITNALYESLVYHRKLLQPEDALRKTLPFGLKIDNPSPDQELPVSPDHENFEALVKAKLKRYVVENCIYGVDLNPTAVELARLSLWIETMDKNLPFEFLDHKIKVGNSLVGAWLDTFQEYPLAAWLREGGDKNHSTSVHYPKGAWTKAIKDKLNDTIKPELAEVISLRAGQLRLDFMENLIDPIEEHKTITQKYNELHTPDISLFGLEQKAKLYFELLNSESYKNVKSRMDLWCAIWFWPADKIDLCPTPKTFYKPTEEIISIAKQVAEQLRFFHWEIEFPDVFNPGRNGFDAIVGNPPWEISKPNSKEFFSNLDPIYRTYGKQDALNHQRRLFESNESIEYNWLSYNANFKGMSNYVKNAAFPFGDPDENDDNIISLARGSENSNLHKNWRIKRREHKCFADPNHPFRFQGSADLNLYKMFLEYAYVNLKNTGRFGMIVPSGIYSDKGTQGLRDLFINKSKWEWLYSFENRQKIFSIDSRFKFNPIIVQKNGETDSVKTAFMQHAVSNWEDGKNVLLYRKEQIKKFSPNNLGFLEITSSKDSYIIQKIYDNAILLGDESLKGWSLEYAREYDSDTDSKFFNKKVKLENEGFVEDEYGRWIKDEKVGLPLYEGRMISQFDFSNKRYIRGSNRSAVWEEIEFEKKKLSPQYLIIFEDYKIDPFFYKIGFMRIGSATNTRSMYACLIDNMPCTDSVPVLYNKNLCLKELLFIPAVMNSFVYDFVLRVKLGGVQINYFIIDETPILSRDKLNTAVSVLSAKLTFINNKFSYSWIELSKYEGSLKKFNWKSLWAITPHERLRLRCILDAIVAELYGLDYEDFAWILRDDPSDPKGFWRVDKEKPKELRQTTLTLQAFKKLKEIGLDEFIKEDWQFPKEIQDQLGPRFLDWQLKGTPEESWAECEYHAKQILGEEGFKKFIEELESGEKKTSVVKEETEKYGKDDDLRLF